MNYRTVFHNLGRILTIVGLFMLLPVVAAIIFRERTGLYFAGTAAVIIVIGTALVHLNMNPDRLKAREGFAIVGLSWIMLSLIGAFPLFLSGEIPDFASALFESTSGFTTTGATIMESVESLSRCVILWRSLSHWLGGMGILVFMLAILPLKAGNTLYLLRAESSGPSVSKIMPHVQKSASILYGIYILLTAVETLLLYFGGMSLFDSLNYAMSTAATGGFGTTSAGAAAFSSNYIRTVLTVFMFMFGLNFNVYFLILVGKAREIFKITEIKAYFIIIFVSILTISFSVRGFYSGIQETIQNSAFTVAAMMTSSGFAITDYTMWPQYPKVLLSMLMVIGACSGSTCGSIKISRAIILAKGASANLRRLVSPRSVKNLKLDGKPLERDTLADVNTFMAVYLIIMAVSLLLLSFDGLDFVTNGSAVLATLNNIGIGFGQVGPAGSFAVFPWWGKLILCFDMIAGRLELFPVIILLMPRTWRRH